MTRAEEPPLRRLRLTVHYDGGAFHGWQSQPAARTVQAELEQAIERLTTRTIRIAAAGRTDRGVHATGQVVSLDGPARWNAAELARALNAVLPPDVWVAEAADAAPDFHARFSAIAREYVYRIGTEPVARSPFVRRWCWPLGRTLDIEALNGEAGAVLGTHSFKAFAKSGQPERGEQCTVHRSDWEKWAHGVRYRIVANRFLHHMVRYLVGTMAEVGFGRRPVGTVRALLAGKAGLESSPPAPPEGLCLTRVYYDDSELGDEDATHEILP